MKVAVNTRFLLKDKLEGLGWFSYEVLKRIVINHPEVDFLFLFDREYSEEFIFSKNVKGLVLSPQARHPILYHIWFEYSIPRALKRENIDVFFSPEAIIPLTLNIPTLNVMHDIVFEHYPKGVKPFHLKYYKKYFPKFARKTDKIIAVSHFTKKDLINTYSIEAQKIVVAQNGVGEQYRPSNKIEIDHTRQNYSDSYPYFLFVGALQPRKNLIGLFRAFDNYKKDNTSSVKLLIVGSKSHWTSDIESSYKDMQHKDDVIFTGRLNSQDLVLVYAAALALVYVPFIEGFGLPIVEAFQSGIPVITSNITSMPEVAGNAALLVDPYSIKDISNSMSKLASDESLRDEMIGRGNEQVKQYSWDRSASIIWQEIEKLVDGKS